jgi:hypothetical protein
LPNIENYLERAYKRTLGGLMKYILFALVSLIMGASAQAYLGYPSTDEMNAVTIQKVKAIVQQQGLVKGSFSIHTIIKNNKYRLDAKNGCVYKARVVWDEFGWPNVDDVKVKLVSCKREMR